MNTWVRLEPLARAEEGSGDAGPVTRFAVAAACPAVQDRAFQRLQEKERCGRTVRPCLGLPQGRPGLCTDVGRIWTAAPTQLQSEEGPPLSAGVITGRALLAALLSDPVRSGVAAAWFWAHPHRGRQEGVRWDFSAGLTPETLASLSSGSRVIQGQPQWLTGQSGQL